MRYLGTRVTVTEEALSFLSASASHPSPPPTMQLGDSDRGGSEGGREVELQAKPPSAPPVPEATVTTVTQGPADDMNMTGVFPSMDMPAEPQTTALAKVSTGASPAAQGGREGMVQVTMNLGVRLGADLEDDGTALFVHPSSQAELMGLGPGDRIIAVGATNVTTTSEVLSLIQEEQAQGSQLLELTFLKVRKLASLVCILSSCLPPAGAHVLTRSIICSVNAWPGCRGGPGAGAGRGTRRWTSGPCGW